MKVYPLILTMTFSTASFGEQVFIPIEPFLGARYGLGYDLTSQSASAAGQSCVTFDAQQINSEKDGVNKSKKTQIKKSADLVKTMNLSAMAQFKALSGNYEGKSTLEIADKSEAHQFSETKLFYFYKKNDTNLLLTEAISIKPEFKTLLDAGITGIDSFRAKCGNAFIVGQQTGTYYYGTAYKSSASSATTSNLNIGAKFSFKSGVKFDSNFSYIVTDLKKNLEEIEEVNSATTDTKLTAPTNAVELEEQWKNFNPASSEDKIISTVVAPYTVAKGALPEGVLAGSAELKKLEVLLDALWDLKTLKDEAKYILKKPDKFALGLPATPKAVARIKATQSLLARWQSEYDSLLTDTKSCVNTFNDSCKKLANWYEVNQRISEEALLPKKYKSYCYGKFTVQHDESEGGGFSKPIFMSGKTRGDDEMGGGPVLVKGQLSIYPNGRELRMRLDASLEENKSDHSTFVFSVETTVFTMQPKELPNTDIFEECVFADQPINAKSISPGNIYGKIEDISGKNPRGMIKYNGNPNGLIPTMTCEVDTQGKDNGRLNCQAPNVRSFEVLLVNRLDKEAENWNLPQLSKAPNLKYFSP